MPDTHHDYHKLITILEQIIALEQTDGIGSAPGHLKDDLLYTALSVLGDYFLFHHIEEEWESIYGAP